MVTKNNNKNAMEVAASASPAKILARWLGVRDKILTGGVYAPSDPGRRFTVEFLEQTPEGTKVIARTIASRTTRFSEEIPKGYAFEFDIPEEWLDGNVYHPVFRVVENGQLFPRKPIPFVQEIPPPPSIEPWQKSLVAMIDFLKKRDSRPVLFVVTHETSLTGAPIVALNVLKQIKAAKNWTCVALSLADHSVMLDDQFRDASDCFAVVNGWDLSIRKRAAEMLREELPPIATSGPLFAIVSSMSSNWISPILGACAIPSIWLVHEYARFFCRDFIDEAFVGSTQLVFPCEDVRNGYLHLSNPVPFWQELCERAVVRPQGIWWRDKGPPGNAVDRAELRSKFREEHGIPSSAFVVMGCGTVIPRKGVDWFVALAHLLKSRGQAPDIHFIWVGGIGQDEFGRSLAADLERLGLLNEGVHFPGEMRNIEPVYAASDLFLMCSRDDPYPNVVLEAVGRGMPLVGFDQGQGTSELIRKHGVGTLVPYQDMAAIEAAILQYKGNPGLLQAHGEAGRNVILERFAFEDYAAALIDLIETHGMA